MIRKFLTAAVLALAALGMTQPVQADPLAKDVFGGAPPDELNHDLHLTVVAAELDASSERIVNYLRTFGVPVNARP